jgi:mono/diheme cytochrome c family protein
MAARRMDLILAMLVSLGGLSLARAQPPAAPAPPAEAPIEPGLALIQGRCVGCHEAGFILQARRSPTAWGDIVSEMIGRGADLTEDEAAQVRAYLEKNWSTPAKAP